MQIPKHIREKACEGLLHFLPKKRLARELGVSEGSIRDWSIYVDNGFFGWVDKPRLNLRTLQLNDAVEYWFEHYPIGYSDVAKRFGVRPATLFNAIAGQLLNCPRSCVPSVFDSGTPNRKPVSGHTQWPFKNSPTFLPTDL